MYPLNGELPALSEPIANDNVDEYNADELVVDVPATPFIYGVNVLPFRTSAM